MILTSTDPFVQEFDRMVQRAFGPWQHQASMMPMDGLRRPDEVLLRFDLPGIDPESIQVTVDRGVLSVSAAREEKYAEDEQPFVRERAMGTFTRRVYLPDHLDTDAIEAAYNHGVLAVRIPVREQAKPRKIEIRQVASDALHEAAQAQAISN